jgi:hypothetical protein
MVLIPRLSAMACLAVALCGAQKPVSKLGALPGDAPPATFGVTVVDSSGLQGQVYLIQEGSRSLPNFKKLKPAGSVYTSSLNISPRRFTEGFPGITDRFEWFAIDYTGRFWIENPGRYYFALLSDDGSKLYIDNKTVIDNDGLHEPMVRYGNIKLRRGLHAIRISYFQGPRDELALILSVADAKEKELQVFDTRNYLPPKDANDPKAAGTALGKQR